MSNQFITVQGVRLHVRRRQGPGEAIVFSHGMTENCGTWDRVIAGISPYYDVISYDLRAHGLSDAPTTGYEIEQHAADLLGIIEQLKLDQVTLVGHSLGADIVMHAAHDLRDRLTAAVLVEPPWREDWGGSPNHRRRALAENWSRWLGDLQGMTVEEIVGVAQREMPHWSAQDMLTWAIAKKQARPQAVASLLTTRTAWQLSLAKLEVPILLLVGESRMGGMVTKEQAQAARELSRLVQVRCITGAGHAVYRDQFSEFLKAIREFLRG